MPTFYTIFCEHCSSEFQVIARKKHQRFCSVNCVNKAKTKHIREHYTCTVCDTPLNRDQKKFCSHSCSASHYNNIRPPTSTSTKEKIRNSVLDYLKKNPITEEYREKRRKSAKVSIKEPKLCIICSNPCGKRKTCSDNCLRQHLSNSKSDYLKNPENRKKYKGNRGRSYMEETFENWLINNGISKGLTGYLTELHFYNPVSKKHGWADFVFPKLKLIIELDGTHHNKRAELDKVRDDYLRSKGYTVLRVTIVEYKKNIRLNEIKSLLSLK